MAERDPFDIVMTYLSYNRQPAPSFFAPLRDRDVGFVVIRPLVWFE
jgi:hypothetical protein